GTYPWGIVHTPGKGLVHMLVNAVRLNFWIFGWPLSWVPVFIGCRRRSPLTAAVVLMLAGTFILYVFYFWPGMCDTGPAYYYFLLPFLSLAAAQGILAAGAQFNGPVVRFFKRPALVFAVLSCISVTFFLPVQCAALRRVTARIREPYDILAAAVEPPALVFTPFYFYVTYNTHGKQRLDIPTPLVGLRNNAPDASDPVLLVRDLGERNRELIRLFPGRKPYRFRKTGRSQYELEPLGDPCGKRVFSTNEGGGVSTGQGARKSPGRAPS
ncbi:hypothetical protein JW905_10320, partial [bacterium]|nr:hypothetical protein [candidate division CSSED10-310 bacterium]